MTEYCGDCRRTLSVGRDLNTVRVPTGRGLVCMRCAARIGDAGARLALDGCPYTIEVLDEKSMALIGTLPHPVVGPRGNAVNFPIRTPIYGVFECVTLFTCEHTRAGSQQYRLAYKSGNASLELLRRINEFNEYKP